MAVELSLHKILESKGKQYNRLFNDLLEDLELYDESYLREALDTFRSVSAELAISPKILELLQDLKKQYKLGMITGGMPDIQRNKIELLRISGFFEIIIFSSTLVENKPLQVPFLHLLDLTQVPAAKAVYVGDNPETDFKGANEVGMWTIRVHNPEFEGTTVDPKFEAQLSLDSVCDLRLLFL